jgi:small subunit ribosomal protein S8
MLTRIRNANKALQETATMPTSRMKESIARLLKEEGYIRDFRVEKGEAFDSARRRAEVRAQPRARHHQPEAHLQAGSPHLCSSGPHAACPGRHGDTAILSTSSGLMTSRTAEERGIAAKVICFVW